MSARKVAVQFSAGGASFVQRAIDKHEGFKLAVVEQNIHISAGNGGDIHPIDHGNIGLCEVFVPIDGVISPLPPAGRPPTFRQAQFHVLVLVPVKNGQAINFRRRHSTQHCGFHTARNRPRSHFTTLKVPQPIEPAPIHINPPGHLHIGPIPPRPAGDLLPGSWGIRHSPQHIFQMGVGT